MEFNRTELENLLNGMSAIIANLEKCYAYSKSTTIYLANGERIEFEITKSSLAHLLGVDTNYLASLNIFREKSSYELLKKMCEEAYKIHDLHVKKIINYDQLFSKNIIEKLSGFWKNININCEETELVCKYDASRSYKSNEITEKFDYIIVKNINGKYYMLCLVKNSIGVYLPMSNRCFESYDELQEQLSIFLVNQEITFMNSSKLDENKPYYLDDKQKLEKAKNLEDYRKMYNCSIDLTGQYKYMLSGVLTHKNSATENYTLTGEILTSITGGKIIDTTKIQDRNLLQIAQAYNDFICSRVISDMSDEVGESYSSIKNEREELKTKLLECRDLITKKDIEISKLTSSNEQLTTRNNELEDTHQKIFSLIKSAKKTDE